jgi:hypothetical protein
MYAWRAERREERRGCSVPLASSSVGFPRELSSLLLNTWTHKTSTITQIHQQRDKMTTHTSVSQTYITDKIVAAAVAAVAAAVAIAAAAAATVTQTTTLTTSKQMQTKKEGRKEGSNAPGVAAGRSRSPCKWWRSRRSPSLSRDPWPPLPRGWAAR